MRSGATPSFKSGPLGGEVLLISGAAGVADQGCGHGHKCTLGLPPVIASAYHLCETLARLVWQSSARAGRTVRWPIPFRTPALAWWPARRGGDGSGKTPASTPNSVKKAPPLIAEGHTSEA